MPAKYKSAPKAIASGRTKKGAICKKHRVEDENFVVGAFVCTQRPAGFSLVGFSTERMVSSASWVGLRMLLMMMRRQIIG